MALALDGSAQGATVSTGNTCAVTLTTTHPPNVIIAACLGNGSAGVATSSVTDTAGLIWTHRSALNPDTLNTQTLDYFWAVSTNALTSDVITFHFNGAVTFGVPNAFGISGADTVAIFDSHAGLPITSAAAPPNDPLLISTTNANDFIFAIYEMFSTASPTSGAGWTQIVGANFMLIEYQIVAAAQTNLSAGIGTGSLNSQGAIGDAVIQGTAAVVAGVGLTAVTAGASIARPVRVISYAKECR